MAPVHYLHIYQKPTLGNAFIRRYPTYKYKHKISANGWFDTMSCALAVTRIEAELLFESMLMNRVAVFAANPAEAIWEGLITRVTYTPGNVTFTRSTDEMMNRVTVRSAHNISGTLSEQESGENNDTDSQAIYGIKAGTIDGGAIWNGSTQTTYMQALRDTQMELRAWPLTSTNFSGNNAVAAFLTIECEGFYHKLMDEETTQQTNANAGTTVTNVLTNLVNSNTFFDNTDTTDLSANTTFNYRPREATGMSAWDVFKRIQEAGDSSGNLWTVGITPTLSDTGTRRLYYKQADLTVKYLANGRDNMRLRNAYGGLVKPWDVRPNRGIRINDVLLGWNSMGDDPREFYIESVDYDAENGQVQLRGADDITLEGFFQFQRRSKAYNRRAGAPPKQVLLS